MKPIDQATRLRGIANCRRILDYLDNCKPLTEAERQALAEALARPREAKQHPLDLEPGNGG